MGAGNGGDAVGFQLQPGGLYVVVSTPRRTNDESRRDETLPAQLARRSAKLEWQLYWCKSSGIGQTFKYQKTQQTWHFEHRWLPNPTTPGQVEIEVDDQVIVALQIEHMDEDMASLIEERLDPKRFQHSHSYRPRSVSEMRRLSISEGPNERDDEEGRDRKWLGHALILLNDTGFISLKDGAKSAALIEGEVLATAGRNLESQPALRTVTKSHNVQLDSR